MLSCIYRVLSSFSFGAIRRNSIKISSYYPTVNNILHLQILPPVSMCDGLRNTSRSLGCMYTSGHHLRTTLSQSKACFILFHLIYHFLAALRDNVTNPIQSTRLRINRISISVVLNRGPYGH